MSDTNTGDQAPAAGGNGAAEAQKPPVFGVVSQYVKDLSFENPRAPATLGKPLPGNGIKIELNVNSKKLEGDQPGLYEVELKVNARAGEGDETAFALELVYGGVVRVENVPDQNIHPLVTIEG
ncbi:MAG: protein-export chaperone SecB, partial [Pseudomonadota bacterium]